MEVQSSRSQLGDAFLCYCKLSKLPFPDGLENKWKLLRRICKGRAPNQQTDRLKVLRTNGIWTLGGTVRHLIRLAGP